MTVTLSSPKRLPADAKRVQARVLYADTDKMGIVYHASYLRYLELARGELLRDQGLTYHAMEAQGLALPLTEVAVHYTAPALYDDVLSVRIGVVELTAIRVGFAYQVTVEPGDRVGCAHAVRVLSGQTRHACVHLATGRPTRLPTVVAEALRACLAPTSTGVRQATDA